MRFADSDTQTLIRKTARAYLAGRYPAERLYAIERGDAGFGEGDLRELADLGWLALTAPEAIGGAGVSLLDAAVVIEECGYAAAPLPIAMSNIAAELLSRSEGGASSRVARLAAGDGLYTVHASKRLRGAGGTPEATVADRRLSGTLELVPFGAIASFVVTPVHAQGTHAMALVSLDQCGRDVVRTLDRWSDAHISLDGLDANAVSLVARGREAEAMQERCDALVTAFGLIETSGMLQRVLEMTSEYISHRVQFGQPIAKFQAARHRAAELLTQADTVRWTAYHALWRLQEDPDDTSELWLAKHWAIRAAERAFQITHLLHGGVGVGTDYPLHLYTQAIGAFAVRGGGMDEMVRRTLDDLPLGSAARAGAERQRL
jgi:alkylation response protein AidB-like acyl-CoA dehydrogenase